MKKRQRMHYQVRIDEAVNGFIVNVGCEGPIVVASQDQLKQLCDDYYTEKPNALIDQLLKDAGMPDGAALATPEERMEPP